MSSQNECLQTTMHKTGQLRCQSPQKEVHTEGDLPDRTGQHFLTSPSTPEPPSQILRFHLSQVRAQRRTRFLKKWQPTARIFAKADQVLYQPLVSTQVHRMMLRGRLVQRRLDLEKEYKSRSHIGEARVNLWAVKGPLLF